MPFGFSGGIYDAETGFVRFGARDYDPGVGRWITKDPLAFEGDGPNLYAYVENDPVNSFDPSGLSKTDKLYGLARQFWNWFHRNVKVDGDPDLSRAEAEALHDEWKKLGKPGPDNKGPKGPKGGGDDATGGGFSDWLDSIVPFPDIPTDMRIERHLWVSVSARSMNSECRQY